MTIEGGRCTTLAVIAGENAKRLIQEKKEERPQFPKIVGSLRPFSLAQAIASS